jgi:hypothetical protein
MYKKRDQVVYYIDLTKPLPQQLQDRASECAASGVTIRPFNRLRLTRDLKIWIDLLRETFANHWGYIPVSDREITSRFGVKHLRWFDETSLFLFAEIRGEPIAYLWATPDYNQVFRSMKGHLGLAQILQFLWNKHHINMGKLHLIGIKKKFQNRHIGSYLNYAILTEMKKRGYIGAEVGWIDEKNTVAHKTIALTGAQVYKKFRVFDINITDT